MRKISLGFLKDLSSGVLKPIVDAVKESNGELILCFREDYVNIYYKSHSVFHIKEQSTHYKITFNLGHARYTAPFEELGTQLKHICEDIKTNHTSTTNKKTGEITDKYTATFSQKKMSESLPFNAIIEVYKQYIDDFFKPITNNSQRDHFKELDITTKKDLLEKQHQQEIFTRYNELSTAGNRMIFYDIELSLPQNIKEGSPDCLAVTVANGKVTGIVLVEVKSTSGACTGSNGIHKHAKDFSTILSSPENRELLYNSMRSAFEYYHTLGFYLEVTDFYDLSECKFDIRFLFTAEAIEWAQATDRNGKDFNTYKELVSEDANRAWKRIEFLHSL